ncbi:MAG: FMN-binding protein [Actinomycetota bacterium]|nr:FMN-binding protein [Actinomycetota bacterium]
MRRVILTIAGTVAGLVALLSFKSHGPSVSPASAATSSGTTSGTSGTTSSGTSSPATTVPGEFPMGSLAAQLTPGETTVTGHVGNTVYGPVQIQLVMRNSKIVKVAILKQPMNTIHDIQIGAFAFPKLIGETLSTQTAKIDSVSGASYTSAGYLASLQSALDLRG